MLSYKSVNENSRLVAISSSPSGSEKPLYYTPDIDGAVTLDRFMPDIELINDILSLRYPASTLSKSRVHELMKTEKACFMLPHKDDAVLIPLMQPESNDRVVYYISGQSGSGKSTLTQKIVKYMSRVIPCFYLSPIPDSNYEATLLNVNDLVKKNTMTDEAAYKEAKIIFKHKKKLLTVDERIEMETKIEQMKPKAGDSEFTLTDQYRELIESTKPSVDVDLDGDVEADEEMRSESLWVYDDCEVADFKKKMEYLQGVQLVTGRHDLISMIILNHLNNDGLKTRLIIAESHVFIVFRPFNKYVRYFLSEYMSFDPNTLRVAQRLLLRSRYIVVYPKLGILASADIIIRYIM